MDQTPHPVSRRADRPHLFGATSAADRHVDFGPSILETIDHGYSLPQKKPRARFPTRLVLWSGVLVFGAAALYFASKQESVPTWMEPVLAAFDRRLDSMTPPAAAPAAAIPVASPAPVVAAVVADPAVQGPAAVENMPQAAVPTVVPTPPAASAPPAVPTQVDSAAAEPAVAQARPPAAPKVVHAKSPTPTHVAARPRAAEPANSPRAAKPAARNGRDEDADLLAAMLPHLNARNAGTPSTSPAYEKRCGQLRGDEANICRAKFCNGREGADAACPAVTSSTDKP